MNRHSRWWPGAGRGAVIAACMVAFCAATGLKGSDALAQAARSGDAGAQPAQSIVLPDFTALVKRYGPAVVNVSAIRYPTADSPRVSGGDPLDDFLRRLLPPPPDQRGPEAGTIGSGFIIDAEGYILTSAHVVTDADEILVKLTDMREIKARLIGVDRPTDIALLKIEAKDLTVLPMGDSGKLQVGEWVMAIGSPFGFDSSVTVGVVSAIGRILPDEQYVPFIQTDVPVNPGNSGGPLINMQGNVVGINAQIFSRSGGYMGISFAIPINLAIEVKEDLRRRGRVNRGRLGIVSQDLTPALGESFGLPGVSGALISAVEPEGPAGRAGLEAGDIVVLLNSTQISSATDLSRAVAVSEPGITVRLRAWRRGAVHEIEARVGELAQPGPRPPAARGDARTEDLGLVLRELRPAEQRVLQAQGRLYVQSATGRAGRAGVMPGDIILGVNNDRVDTVRELEKLLAGAGRSAALLVQREDSILFVPLRLSDG